MEKKSELDHVALCLKDVVWEEFKIEAAIDSPEEHGLLRVIKHTLPDVHHTAENAEKPLNHFSVSVYNWVTIW